MGRLNELPELTGDDVNIKLNLVRLPWVSGDYDPGGAYWGNDGTLVSGEAIYYASGVNVVVSRTSSARREEYIRVFVRAANRTDAKRRVREHLPNARFYR